MAVELNTSNVAVLYADQTKLQDAAKQRQEVSVEQQQAAPEQADRQKTEAGPAVVTDISARALTASREATASQPAPETTRATADEAGAQEPVPSANQEPQLHGQEAARQSKIDVIV